MEWDRLRPWLGTVARLLLGVVWIWAALSKLSSPRAFVQTVRAYDATPEWLSKAIGYGLPVLELALGVLLVVGVMVRIAAAVSGVLFLVFLIGLIQAAARGIQLECGCFGGGGTTAGSTSYTLDILRDIGLLIVAAYLVVWSFTHLSIEEFLARNDRVVMPSAKRMRTADGRRKYEAQLAVARSAAKDRSRYVDGSLALVVVLISIIGLGVQAQRAKIAGDLTAPNASVSNGVVFGKKAAATVDIYEDFGCPICEQFEADTSTWFQGAVRANLAQARYHPISILDGNSPNQYSTRAANAALCASDVGVDTFVAYHNLLYGKVNGKQFQPKEGTAGPSDQQLNNLGATVKLTTAQQAKLRTCVQTQQHKPLVEALTERASEHSISSTPTVLVDGKQVDATLPALQAAIKKADAGGPKPSPSKTPTPTPTPTPATPSPTLPSSPGSGSASSSTPPSTPVTSASSSKG